jgi:hypothetical protein
MICIYKVDNIRAHGTNPLMSPLDNSPFAWRTLPCFQVPLTYLEFLLCVWCDPCPPWSQVACKLTSSPLPFPSPMSLPVPQWFPILIVCPSTMTSRHQHHIVRYINYKKISISYAQAVFSIFRHKNQFVYWENGLSYETIHILKYF